MLCNFTFSWDAAAVFVAACALILSILSQRAAARSQEAAEKHNRLSVRPRLTSSTDQEHVVNGDGRATQVRATLANVGLGPAIIRRAEVLFDGIAMPVETADDIRPHLEALPPGLQLGSSIAFMKLNEEHAMAVGEVYEIVRFQVLNPPDNFKEQLERFSLLVRYESMYGDPEVYDSRKHRSAAIEGGPIQQGDSRLEGPKSIEAAGVP